MKTPIYDFVKKYSAGDMSRFHMPGHKGSAFLGCEAYDITEIAGADVLYSADGIIDESEIVASELFGTAHTYYSTEGSTLCIKAMLKLVTDIRKVGTPRLVFAARGVHRAFVNACALLDIDVAWIYPTALCHECDATVTAKEVEQALAEADVLPQAVYITSPNYLGGVSDIKGISTVCKKYGVPLIVDNAHGAYLRFLEEDAHPITLGAAMCADSAHKTLPVLTGGAYLHVSREWLQYCRGAREALSLFASTSPSYLTLASLDLCNEYLSEGYRERLAVCCAKVDALKHKLLQSGVPVRMSEPMKIVIAANEYGYTGYELSEHLRKMSIEAEFADDVYLVLMTTPENSEQDYDRLYCALTNIKKRNEIIIDRSVSFTRPKTIMSIRAAMLSLNERISVSDACGRILSDATVSCPPAVPVVVSGERIDQAEIELMQLHGIEYIRVVIE